MDESDIKCDEIEINKFDISFKILILGDSGVGKSLLSMKATQNYLEDFNFPTIIFNYFTFFAKINELIVELKIWDTSGQEKEEYLPQIKSIYKNISLAILVYSINDYKSFENLEKWLDNLKLRSYPDIKIILVGNKNDLEEQRVITKEMGEIFCNNHKLTLFMETSAKTGSNVQNLFMKSVKILYKDVLGNKPKIIWNNVNNLEIEKINKFDIEINKSYKYSIYSN